MGQQASKDDGSIYKNGANRHNDVLTDKENRRYKRYTIHHKRTNNDNSDILSNSADDINIINNSNGTTTTDTLSNSSPAIHYNNNNNINNNQNNNNNCKPINNNNNNQNNSSHNNKSKFLQRKSKAKTINLSNTTDIGELQQSINSSSSNSKNNNINSSSSSFNSSTNSLSNNNIATVNSGSSHSSLLSTFENNDSLLSLSSGITNSSVASLDDVSSVDNHNSHPTSFNRTRSKSLNLYQNKSYLSQSVQFKVSGTNNSNNNSTNGNSDSSSPLNEDSKSTKIQGRKSKSSNALLRTLQRKVKKDKDKEDKKEKEKEEKKEKKDKEKEKKEKKEESKTSIKLSTSSTNNLSESLKQEKSKENLDPKVQPQQQQQVENSYNIYKYPEEEQQQQQPPEQNYEELYTDNFKLNPLSPTFESAELESVESSSQLKRKPPPPLPPKNFKQSQSSNNMDTPGLLSPLSIGQGLSSSPMLSRKRSDIYPPSEPSMPSPCSSQRNSVELHKLEDIYNYTLLEKIGSGTFSDVHLCKHKETDKLYAIKIIDKSLVQMIASHTDLDISTEVNILNTLSHPHIINLVEHFESELNYYIIMEYLSGGELLYQLEETHNNPDNVSGVANYTEQSAREIIKQIIHAVNFLHKNNIVHRDLKPENILFNAKNKFATLKIIDFGLASYYKAPLSDICGTPDFQAPEMIKRQGYSYPVDIWATGVILYILLCGHPPFQGKNSMAIMSLIMKGEIKFDKPEWESVSESAKDLILKMLDSDPSKRLTAEQVLQHEWMLIQTRPEDSPRLSGSFHKQLRRYNSQRYFKATGDTLLKSQRYQIYQSPELLKRRSIQENFFVQKEI